jgi:hypothetical protein
MAIWNDKVGNETYIMMDESQLEMTVILGSVRTLCQRCYPSFERLSFDFEPGRANKRLETVYQHFVSTT